MTWTRIQKSAAEAITAGGTTVTPTLPGGSSAGNLLVCYLTNSSNAAWTLPAGWVQVVKSANSGNCAAELWYYPANPGGISSVLCTSGTSANLHAALEEFHTDVASPVFTISATGTGTAGAVTQCAVTTGSAAKSGDLAVCCFHHRLVSAAALTWTDPSGFTLALSDTASATHHMYSADDLSVPAAALTVTGKTSVAADSTFGWSGLIATFTATPAGGVGAPGQVGAFNNQNIFGAGTTVQQAIGLWVQLASRPLTVRRVYFSAAWPSAVTGDLLADAAAGRKVCISFRPAFNPPSNSDASLLDAFLSSCKTAGVNMDVALYPEAYTAGMTAAQTIAATRFYAATVRQYYPLVFNTGTFGVLYHNENSYYAGDAYIDKITTDYYCNAYVNGDRLGTAASLADGAVPPKPFGIWEFNSSADPVAGQTQAQATTYFGYLKTFFSARLTAGKSNADLILFNSGGDTAFNSSPITTAGDYRLPLWQSLFDALDAASGTTILTITTSSLPAGTQNAVYPSQTLAATGGTPAYTWSVVTGALPTGLSLSSGGVLSGTPSVSGVFNFTVQVADSAGHLDIQAYSLVLGAATVAVSVSTSSVPPARVGSAYSFTFTASDGVAPFTWTVFSGTLPTGLTLSSGGVLSGTPTAVGAPAITFKVTDATTGTATVVLTVTVLTAITSVPSPIDVPIAPSTPETIVTWIGQAGTFGSLPGLSLTSTGHTLMTQAIDGWGFGAGEAVFYALAAPFGQIILSSVPLSENEILPTMDHAEISVYDPVRQKFYRNIIPTSRGIAQTLQPGRLTGGTDVGGGDLCVTPDGRILYTCTGYWFGWDIPSIGLYPGIGFLNFVNGNWVFDNYAVSKTNNQLQATNPALFNTLATGVDQPPPNFLTGDNANFDATAGTWTGAGNCNTARVTSPVHAGAGALSLTSISAVAGTDMAAASCQAANILTQGLACSPGDTIEAAAWFRSAVSARVCSVGVAFYTAAGTLVNVLYAANTITDSTSAYTLLIGNVAAPATAAFCRLQVRVAATGGASEVHYIDDAYMANITVAGGVFPARGIGQMNALPVSGHIAVAHYFAAPGFNSGLVSVWDQNANLKAVYQIPSMNAQDATTSLIMAPRELKADPSSVVNDERFMIIYDVFPSAGNAAPIPSHVMQEFKYNASGPTITPITVPFIAADDYWAAGPCEYGADGTLYCAGSVSTATPANFLTGDTATFDAGLGNWGSGNSNCATLQVATPVHSGAGSMRMRSTAGGTMQSGHCATGNILTQGLACSPGDTIRCSAWFIAAASARSCAVGANFYDSAGVFLSTVYGVAVADNTTAYQQISSDILAPASAARAKLQVEVLSTGAANEDHFVDDPYLANITVNGGLVSLNAQNTAVWVKHAGGDRDFATLVPATTTWATDGRYASKVVPNYSLGFAPRQALGGAAPLGLDPLTGSVLYPGLYNGQLGAAIPDNPGSTPDPSVTIPANLIPGALPNALYGFEDVVNMVALNDALLLDGTIGNWGDTFATCTLAWTAAATPPAPPPGGGNCLLATSLVAGADFFDLHYPGGPVPVTVGTTYGCQVSFLAKAGTPGQSSQVTIRWLDNAGAFLSQAGPFSATDNTSTWVTVRGQGVAPASAAYAQLAVAPQTTTIGHAHYYANFGVYDMTAPAGWTGFVSGLVRDSAQARSGSYSLAVNAPFAQGAVFVSSPLIRCNQYREYIASGYVRAKSGVAAGPCWTQIRWYDINQAYIASTIGKYSPNETTSGWTYMYAGDYPPPGAVYVQWCFNGATLNAGDTLYVDDILLAQQPWQAPGALDTGVQQRRSDDGSVIGPGRPAITGTTMWIPMATSFTGAELAFYNANLATYQPDTTHPQFLVAIDLGFFLVIASTVQPRWAGPALPIDYVAAKPAWHFLYGPPQPAGGITAEIHQAQSMTLTMRTGAGNYSQAELDIDGRSGLASQITELLTDVQVVRGRKLLFAGRVLPTQDTLDSDQHRLSLTALDYRDLLHRRMLLDALNFTGSDAGFIAWKLVEKVQGYPGGNLGIRPGRGQVTGFLQTWSGKISDMIGDDIDQLSQMTPGSFDWDITPYGTSDLRLDIWAGQRGTNKGVVLELGGNLVAQITRNVDPTSYANAVYVTGDGAVAMTPQQLTASDITSRPEGRWDQLIGTTIQLAASLTNAAPWYLQDAEVLIPSYSIVLHPGVWDGPDHIWLGDTVTVRIKSGRLLVNDPLQVMEMAFSVSPDNLETLTLTVGRIPFRLHQHIRKILRDIRHLKTR